LQLALINRDDNFCWYFEVDHNNEFAVSKRNCPQQFNTRDWDDGWNHVYIEVKSCDAFEFCDLNDYINPDYIERIKNPDSNWVLHINNSHEAFLDMPSMVYLHICKKYDIPTQKIILANGAFDLIEVAERIATQYNVPVFKVELVLDFELAQRGNEDSKGAKEKQLKVPKTLQVDKLRKTYLCMNRRWRLHRPLFVACLAANDMLDDGFVSLAPSDDEKNWHDHVPGDNEGGVFQWIEHCCERNAEMESWLLPKKNMIQNLKPMYLDTEDLATNRARFTWRPGYLYAQSLVSVVTETNYFTSFHSDNDRERSIFFSEKIFKPIAFEHPFIVVSTPNFLTSLKAIGYRTFDKLIDESYDNEQDDFKRMCMVINELKRLSKLTYEEKAKFCEEAALICEHNRRILTRRKNFNYKMNY
jgi:hypothetical protein|tara:strand:- start:3692 stop:4936 length:1245 start_codon:yes stop_codon:yes gene_type:complete